MKTNKTEIKGRATTAVVMLSAEHIDETTRGQIQEFVNNENFKDAKIRIMPDTHAGKGSVIGFTMPVGKRVCPNIVGVDIGCGMVSVNIGKNDYSKERLIELDKIIRKEIPLGFKSHIIGINSLVELDKKVKILCKKIGMDFEKSSQQLGTLGGGNHFIELGVDETGNNWLTVHSGSRRLGKEVCDYHQRKAIATDKTAKFKEIAHLSEEDTKEYLEDMKTAQMYANFNRDEMILQIILACKMTLYNIIKSVHNFIDFEDNIIRKGAIRSYVGEKMIIPFNMRDGLLICEGKSNEEWNNSAPHGAGRVLSRTKAKNTLSLDEFEKTMEGIYVSNLSKSLLDESPMAYKDKEMIEEAIEETAKILHRVKPLLNIKA